jgi:DNA end-binding protein Ku
MAYRSIWKGSINFGMVAIPAKLFTATDDKRVSFHQYHSECQSRLQMPKWCPVCQRKVETSEIKRGYELSESQHIILEEQDFQSLPLKSLKQIEVVQFVNGAEIDIRAVTDCYFLSCEDVGAKAFTLFLKAMQSANLVAIAKLTYREREHLSVIRAYDGIMLLQTLHYADELRPYDELRPRQVTISDKEMEMALALINTMTGKFDLADYHDDYREALEQLIQAKLNGEVITAPAEIAPVSDGDMVDALMRSIKMASVKA